MKVFHLLKTSIGAAWALRQMRELVHAGVEVHAAMPGDGPLVTVYEDAGVTVHRRQFDLPVRRPWEWPRLFNELQGLVAEIQPDLLHSHFVGTTLTMRMALRRHASLPRLFQVPGPLHLEHPAFRAGELSLADATDFWIGSCKWTCDRYARSGIPRDRIFLAYYGIDLQEFRCHDPGRLRHELGVPDSTRIVGMVAYMYAPKRYLGHTKGLKGHEDLIDAFALLRRERTDVRCVMVGSAWNGAHAYEQRVRSYARQRCGESVIFLGRRTDVQELYSDFDVAVHPSHSENVGGAVESLLLGVPTITTNVGGFPDLVRDPETGWLVPPRSPESLAKAIAEALDHPSEAQQRAVAGQGLARRMFDMHSTGRDVFHIYEQVLGRHSTRAEKKHPAEAHA